LLLKNTLKTTFALLASAFTFSGCGYAQQQGKVDSIVVEVTGSEFNWHFRYPGLDGILGTSDDQHSMQNLYLPENADVTLRLSSNDYVYSFALPELDLKEIAVPDLSFELVFKTNSKRKLLLLGDQFCGYSHKTLIGSTYIVSQDSGFYNW